MLSLWAIQGSTLSVSLSALEMILKDYQELEKLKNFVLDNHHIVMYYHRRYYRYATCFTETPYDRIRALFLNALEASGVRIPLDDKYSTLKYFSEKISPLKNSERFSFESFARCFYANFNSPDEIQSLSEALINDSKLRQFGKKKANLFLKELVLLTKGEVFKGFHADVYLPYLRIPIDAVIRKAYWHLQKLPKPYSQKYDDEIQRFGNELFPNRPIYLDDLWFWGHFTFQKDQLGDKANEAMVYTDKCINEKLLEEYDLINKLNLFIQIMRELKKSKK